MATLLVLLDKAGKLRGAFLLIPLAIAAIMTLPLILDNGWVNNAPSGMLRFTRGMLMVFLLGVIYSILGIWISGDNAYSSFVRISIPSETENTATIIQPFGSSNPSLDNWVVDGSKLVKSIEASRSSRTASVTIDTSYLLPFSKGFSFMMIVRVEDNSVEALTDTKIEKSQSFTITGEVRTFQINLSEDFIQKADVTDKRFNKVSLQYYFALIPKHIRPEQILTLSDIVALGGRQLLTHPSPEIHIVPVKGEPLVGAPNALLLNVGVRSIIVYDGPGDLSLYMVRYKSMLGDTASPVYYLANISITNQQNIISTVEGFSVAVGDSESGPWQDLKPISLLSSNLHALGIRNSGTKSIGFPRGTYWLRTPMTREDMAHAALLDVSPKLEAQLKVPIQPYQTISGWAAFDLIDHNVRRVRNYIRIVVRDSTGKVFSGVAALPKRQPGDTEMDTQVGVMIKIGPIVDISSLHVRYYSDPYPKP